MKIIFIPDGIERVYSRYDPVTGVNILFSKSGEEKEVPDSIAEKMIIDFPRMFGKSIEKIQGIRGEKVLIVEKVVEIQEYEVKHPVVIAFKKLGDQLKKTDGKDFEKKPPMKKLIKKLKGR